MVDVGEVFEIPEFDVSDVAEVFDVADVFDVPEVYSDVISVLCYLYLTIN